METMEILLLMLFISLIVWTICVTTIYALKLKRKNKLNIIKLKTLTNETKGLEKYIIKNKKIFKNTIKNIIKREK